MRTGRAGWVLRKQAPLLGLIALMTLVFLAQAVGRGWDNPFKMVPVEVIDAWQSLRLGKLDRPVCGELATMLTSAFLHGDFSHLLFNMLLMWVFGALAAHLLGWRWMLGLFLATAFGGSLCHVLLNRDSLAPTLGASGAVMGFEGAYLGLAARFNLPEPQVWPMARPVPPVHLAAIAMFGVAMDYVGLIDHAASNIAYGAHIGGFTVGLFLTALAAPMPHGASTR